jgi:hypothetical protein
MKLRRSDLETIIDGLATAVLVLAANIPSEKAEVRESC